MISPGWGRYIRSDPIGLMGGLNTYSDAGANPLKFIDRRGLQYYAIPYDPSYYEAALGPAIVCAQNMAACGPTQDQIDEARANQLNNPFVVT